MGALFFCGSLYLEPPLAFHQALPELASSFGSRPLHPRVTFLSGKVTKAVFSCRALDILRFAEKPGSRIQPAAGSIRGFAL